MTPEDCARIGKAYQMMAGWVGLDLLYLPGLEDSDFWNDSACILQQLIAQYEGWVDHE